VKKFQVIACALLVMVACKTVSIIPRRPIEVPASLSLSQVEIALFAAISEKPAAMLLQKSLESNADAEESIRLAAFDDVGQSRTGWFPESIEPGRIVTTFRHGSHQLHVAIRYTKFEVTTELLGSENMQQKNGRIHAKAPIWMSALESRIERSLQTVDVLTP
jgi:hypothetical protein